MHMFPIKPSVAPFSQKFGGVLKYFAPVISIRCKNVKLQGQYEGKVQQQNLSPRG